MTFHSDSSSNENYSSFISAASATPSLFQVIYNRKRNEGLVLGSASNLWLHVKLACKRVDRDISCRNQSPSEYSMRTNSRVRSRSCTIFMRKLDNVIYKPNRSLKNFLMYLISMGLVVLKHSCCSAKDCRKKGCIFFK